MDSKKWGSNPPDLYPKMLGQLVANIATLELSLRVVIYLHEVPIERRQPVAKRLTSLRAGDTLEISALTSWDSLGELIAKYNLHNPGATVPEDREGPTFSDSISRSDKWTLRGFQAAAASGRDWKYTASGD